PGTGYILKRRSPMTPMQFREVTFCPEHRRSIGVLENVGQTLTFALGTDPDEAHRLAQVVRCGRLACHPIYDFITVLTGSLSGHRDPHRTRGRDGEGPQGLHCFPEVWDQVHRPLLRDRCLGPGGEDQGADLWHGQGDCLCRVTVPLLESSHA